VSNITLASSPVTLGAVLFPPDTMLDEQTSECIGSVIDVTKKILAEHGHEVDVICAPPSRIYQLMKEGEVDFTVNVKTTDSLPAQISFVDTPFRKIEVKLYSYINTEFRNDIAAIKDFSYHGYRNNLTQQDYTFFDMPTGISAIQFFIKNQTGNLLAYSSTVDYYINAKNLDIRDKISSQAMVEVNSHYAISNNSPSKQKLLEIFNNYAREHNVITFNMIDL
jgi:polar amino acid transport system substrate-binding protein